MTFRFDRPEAIDRLVKDLRRLRRACLQQGGIRRTSAADPSGRSIVFEADFGLEGEAEGPARTGTEHPVQRGLFGESL